MKFEGKNWGFKLVLLVGLAGYPVFMGLGWALDSETLMIISVWSLVLGLLSGFLWFAEASVDSMREYGLGEGVANLYGEERAKFIFGENYKRTEDDE